MALPQHYYSLLAGAVVVVDFAAVVVAVAAGAAALLCYFVVIADKYSLIGCVLHHCLQQIHCHHRSPSRLVYFA